MELVKTVRHPSPARSTIATHPRGKSAVSNGSRLHVVVPGDTRWARRFRDVFNQILDDIASADVQLSEGQKQLARRAATLCITCEKLEGIAASGEDIDLELYGKITDRLGRAFHRLGLKRQQRGNGGLGELIRADQEAQRRTAAQRPQFNGTDTT
jgi:hypothetical protein